MSTLGERWELQKLYRELQRLEASRGLTVERVLAGWCEDSIAGRMDAGDVPGVIEILQTNVDLFGHLMPNEPDV